MHTSTHLLIPSCESVFLELQPAAENNYNGMYLWTTACIPDTRLQLLGIISLLL